MPLTRNLDHSTGVITDASSGIGTSTAYALARRGADVVIVRLIRRPRREAYAGGAARLIGLRTGGWDRRGRKLVRMVAALGLPAAGTAVGTVTTMTRRARSEPR